MLFWDPSHRNTDCNSVNVSEPSQPERVPEGTVHQEAERAQEGFQRTWREGRLAGRLAGRLSWVHVGPVGGKETRFEKVRV